MRIVARRNENNRRVSVVKNLVVIRRRARETKLRASIFSAQAGRRCYCDQLYFVSALDDRQQHAAREVACADEADA